MDSMLDGPEGTQQQVENFRIDDYAIKDKFEKSRSLSMYRENCYLLPENLSLTEIAPE